MTFPTENKVQKPWIERVFGTAQFLRLWSAQVVTSIGEWTFFLVVSIKAAQIGAGTPEGAVALVLLARLGPGFLFSQLAGVFADRFDRRRLMAVCDIARAAIVMIFPLLEHVWQLVALSLALEAFTLLWMPAKEALVPNLVPEEFLPTANTLSPLATYGTFPLALFIMWALDQTVGSHNTDIGFWIDAASFVISAALVLTLVPTSSPASSQAGSIPKKNTAVQSLLESNEAETHAKAGIQAKTTLFSGVVEIWQEMRDGWRLVLGHPALRSVNIGLAVALVGGGMLVPLGTVYSTRVLNADNNGYYSMLMGLGIGLIIGVAALLKISSRLNQPRIFGLSLVLAGVALFAATSVARLYLVVLFLGVAGAAVGVTYILGFTIIQAAATDETRGRVFAAFYSLARSGVLLAMVAAPTVSVVFDRFTEAAFDRVIDLGAIQLFVPGVRVTFWVAAVIISAAGVLALRTLRDVNQEAPQ